MKKKILCLAFVLILCLSVFPFSVFASENEFSIDLTNTSIEDDFGKAFCGLLKPEEFVEKPMDDKVYYLISMEGCSSEGNNVELYFYVYNPSRKDIVKNSALNKLTLATYTGSNDSSANSYSKYDAKLVATHGAKEKSENTTDALLLKYEVNLNKSYDITQDRYYRIAEVELLFEGDSNATAFVAGKEYKFFNGENGVVNCSSKDLTTLEMDAFHTFYRVDTEGVDKYVDIQSIYFPVSNELVKLYGSIYSMDLIWNKLSMAPSLVVDSASVRDSFQNGWIKDHSEEFEYSVLYGNLNLNNMFTYFYRGENVSALSKWIKYYGSLSKENARYEFSSGDTKNSLIVGQTKDSDWFPIGSVFYSSDVKTYEAVSVYGDEILSYIEAEGWRDSLFQYKSDALREQTFTVEQVGKNLQVYKMCSGWEKFFNGKVFEYDTGSEISYSRFEEMKISELDRLGVDRFSQKYLIDKNDVKCESGACGSCVCCVSQNEEYKNCTWFLLRYDTTKYRSHEALVVNNVTGSMSDCNAMVFESEVIRNFDTISVTFKDVKEGVGVYSTFPILRSPTNFSSDAWNPSEKPSLELSLGIFGKEGFDWQRLLQILKIVVFILISLVLLRFILPIVKPIFKTFKRKIKERKNKRK